MLQVTIVAEQPSSHRATRALGFEAFKCSQVSSFQLHSRDLSMAASSSPPAVRAGNVAGHILASWAHLGTWGIPGFWARCWLTAPHHGPRRCCALHLSTGARGRPVGAQALRVYDASASSCVMCTVFKMQGEFPPRFDHDYVLGAMVGVLCAGALASPGADL